MVVNDIGNEDNNMVVYEPNIDFYNAFPEDFEEIENLDLQRRIKKLKTDDKEVEENINTFNHN